jgi:hypothetical protein
MRKKRRTDDQNKTLQEKKGTAMSASSIQTLFSLCADSGDFI